MAKKRMIWKSLSTSKKFNSLSGLGPKLLYTLVLAHTDKEGYYEADPLSLKLGIVPGIEEITTADIELMVCEIERVGLWEIYEIENEQFLKIPNFHEMQRVHPNEPESEIYKKIKGLKPRIPTGLTNDEPMVNQRDTESDLSLVKFSLVKLSKEKEAGKPALSTKEFLDKDKNIHELFNELRRKWGKVGSWLGKRLKTAPSIADYPQDIAEVFRLMIRKERFSGDEWGYADTLLSRVAEKRMTKEREENWQRQKEEEKAGTPEALGKILEKVGHD